MSFRDHFGPFLQILRDECNQTTLSKSPPTDGVYCPAVFDGINCFNYTKANTTAYEPCQESLGLDPRTKVFRHCESDGQWRLTEHNGQKVEWTNSHGCQILSPADEDYIHHEATYVYLFIAGATLSLILLVISLAIFYGFRQLRCDRVTIHKNLFISYIFSAITWIIFYEVVVRDGEVLLENPVWCRVLHVLAQYFTNANFAWMFCEGLYLHVIMAHALRTGKKLIKCLIIGGWGVPAIVVLTYGLVRGLASEDTDNCWIHDSDFQWIYAGPVLASVLINICILVNLVRLLMTKLHQIPDVSQSKKAAKATLILVPLFGLQFLLFPIRPERNTVLHIVYLHVMSLLMSLQGTMVAIIFCFCNGEVRSLVRRKWHQHRLMTRHSGKNTGFTSSTFVDGYSMVDSVRDGTQRTQMVHDNHRTTTGIEAVEMKNCAVTTPLMDKENGVEKTNPPPADGVA